MTYRFEFDPKNKIFLCRMGGAVTDESLKECYWAVAKRAAVTPHNFGILDMSGVTKMDVSAGTLRELAYSEPAMPNPSTQPRFFVAPAPHIYGLARMYQSLGEGKRPLLKVVSTMVEVYEMLGISESPFEPI